MEIHRIIRERAKSGKFEGTGELPSKRRAVALDATRKRSLRPSGVIGLGVDGENLIRAEGATQGAVCGGRVAPNGKQGRRLRTCRLKGVRIDYVGSIVPNLSVIEDSRHEPP